MVFNIFVYPIYAFLEVLFDNLYILTSVNYLLIIFTMSLVINLVTLPISVFCIKKEQINTTKFISFFLIQILLFYTEYLFFEKNELLNSVLISEKNSLVYYLLILMAVGFFITTFFAVRKIIFSSKTFSKKNKYISQLIVSIVFIIMTIITLKTYNYFILLQLLNSLYFLMMATAKENIYKKIIFYLSSFCLIPVLLNMTIIYKFYPNECIQVLLIILTFLIVYGIFLFIQKKHEFFKEKEFDKKIFLSAIFGIFIWIGLYNTILIISSSPTEFSYIGDSKNPFWFVFNTASKAFGFFILFPYLYYFVFSKKIKNILTILSIIVLFLAILNINCMIFYKDFSTLSFDLKLNLDALNILTLKNVLINTILCFLTIFFGIKICLYSLNKNQKFLYHLLIFIIFSGLNISATNSIKIYQGYEKIRKVKFDKKINKENNSASIINLSTKGKNILIIFLDRAIGSFVPDIFSIEDLIESYKGFTFYPNTVTFYGHTILAYPPMIAGYEYTPDNINKRNDKKMVDKYNEALLVLPLMFKNNGFESTVIEPPYENYEIVVKDGKIFEPYNISHKVLEVEPETFYKNKDTVKSLSRNFLYFNIFTATPSIFKKYIYQDGEYKVIKSESEGKIFLDEYLAKEYQKLNSLKEITNISNNEINTFTIFNNDILHINNYDDAFVKEHYELEETAFKILGEYFEFLKENGAFNNTRIIIVSEHGHWKQKNNRLNIEYTAYNPILFIKDFYSENPYHEDMTFMTNADMPIYAVKDVIEKPINPFTKKDIRKEISKNNVRIYTDHRNTPQDYPNTTCLKKGLNYIDVKDNIFDDKNWKKGKI